MKKVRIITALAFIAVICLVSGCSTDKEEGAAEDEPESIIPAEKPPDLLYYREPDKAGRYEAFAAANPDLKFEDAVWMVNAALDKKVYEDTTVSTAPDSLTALVNKHMALPADYEPDDLKVVKEPLYRGKPLAEYEVTKLRKEAAEAFESLRNAAAREDFTIVTQSGYRSFEHQSDLYGFYKNQNPETADDFSSRPGHSEHQTGLAVDINKDFTPCRDFKGTPEAAWVLENSYKYGFIVRYTPENEAFTGYEGEPWHLRYIGADHATRMHDEQITSFEEYWVKFIAHKKE